MVDEPYLEAWVRYDEAESMFIADSLRIAVIVVFVDVHHDENLRIAIAWIIVAIIAAFAFYGVFGKLRR